MCSGNARPKCHHSIVSDPQRYIAKGTTTQMTRMFSREAVALCMDFTPIVNTKGMKAATGGVTLKIMAIPGGESNNIETIKNGKGGCEHGIPSNSVQGSTFSWEW